MANIRIELNRDGVRALLKSDEVEALIAEKCAAIADAASAEGGEYGHDVTLGATRAHGVVWTEDFPARRAEAVNRSLTRAIDAGRG